ncbi:hypothetical protein AAG570_004334, partial [Ranatra chinensis]
RNPDTPDEPYAWEAREFLRKKLIGQTVTFVSEKVANSSREYGTLYLGPDTSGENINELMVKEGLVNIRVERSNSEESQGLKALHEEAKSLHKGKFDENSNPQDHVRNIIWNVEDMMSFVAKHNGKPIKAIIENVRDGSTVRAFLLPDFVYITLMMSGIRCPGFKVEDGKVDQSAKVDFAEEAKYFTECRLLQQDVEIVLDSVNGANFVGTVLHPKGVIAEELLKTGYAHCVDWSIGKMKRADADRLRQAERFAKEKKLNLWKDYTPPPQVYKFVGTVMEVINGDALIVKLPNGTLKKIFLASIRPPREQSSVPPEENGPKMNKGKRLLYDIPWLFEAREFLRKKLVGKKVNVTVDYIQPAKDNYPEKSCCTVTIASVNVAEAMVSRGLAYVIKYRQNDDQRASAYDSLLNAENKAIKSQKGVYAKKDIPTHRINDYSGEPSKAKQLLPHLNRQARIEAVVEFVTNGSRLRLFLPKDSSLITFLLSGIEVRHSEGDGVNNEDAALQFTRERCMQRDVEIRVDSTDRVGNFIGWLWVDNVNLSVALVENGLAKIHFSGENSEFSRQLLNAKNTAKAKGLWKYNEKEETKEVIEEERVVERRVDYNEVFVIDVKETSFYCQYKSQSAKLDSLQAKLAQEMSTNPPLPGAYTVKKGDLCAAKFIDGEWYRARVERVSGNKVSVFYIDYGNRQETQTLNCAPLPAGLTVEKGFAHLFSLACVQLPNPDYRRDAELQLETDVVNKAFLMNVEYSTGGSTFVTLVDPTTKEDVGKKLIAEGFLLVDKRHEKRLQKLISEYQAAEKEAMKAHKNIWEYGDIRDDDDKEFGLGR